MIKIPLSGPDITDMEKQEVLKVLDSPSLSLGPKLDEFEKNFADYIGARYAVAVNSGTSALHLCIKALGIKDDDEVLTTPFSFIASANCILFERAKPIFVDIDEKTLNLDVDKLATAIELAKKNKKSIKAILPVHVFGRPCEMDQIMQLAEENGFTVLEDSCEALGAEYCSNRDGWKKVGLFGQAAVFAFYPNKQITTGEGGMIITSDENIYKLCRSMRNQGRGESSTWLQHERLGYNYRIAEINCALGIGQLRRVDEILLKRETVAKIYNQRLAGFSEIILPEFEENKKISWFVYVIRLTDEFSHANRDAILDKLKEQGIGCSNYFTPIHLQPFYREQFGFKPGDFPITEKISERTIALPFHNNLSEGEISQVADCLRIALDQTRK